MTVNWVESEAHKVLDHRWGVDKPPVCIACPPPEQPICKKVPK